MSKIKVNDHQTWENGIISCSRCGRDFKFPDPKKKLKCCADGAASRKQQPPSIIMQGGFFAWSIAQFIASGCKTVSKEVYKERMKVCDSCEYRKDARCMRCGCNLHLKARGKAFKCPLEKW